MGKILVSRLFLPELGAVYRCNGAVWVAAWGDPRMAEDCLLEAVRGLWLAHPELGPKPLLAKLREQQPDLGAGNKEVREALAALKAESEATEAAAAALPAAAATPAAGEGGAPPNASLPPSLACFGCARLPSEMGDGREKHPVCPICVELKVPTTYWCCVNCPGNPAAWKRHAPYHKLVRRQRNRLEDGGVVQQREREIAEEQARYAAETGDAYSELLAEGARYLAKQDTRRAARAFREAIALRPDRPVAYFNLGAALNNSGHYVEAAQRYLEAKERHQVGSVGWAQATATAFNMLIQEPCAEVAKPEWWNDEELKALSARVVRAAPDDGMAHQMRASVLRGQFAAWEAGPRSAAELREAATHFDRAAALCPAPAGKADHAGNAAWCRATAGAV
jgi:tetratricopeptide (TPR) repeat protein